MKGEIERIWKNKTGDGRLYNVLLIGGERYSLGRKLPGQAARRPDPGIRLQRGRRLQEHLQNLRVGGNREAGGQRGAAAGDGRERPKPKGAPDREDELPALGQPDPGRVENPGRRARRQDDRNRQEVREIHRRRQHPRTRRGRLKTGAGNRSRSRPSGRKHAFKTG